MRRDATFPSVVRLFFSWVLIAATGACASTTALRIRVHPGQAIDAEALAILPVTHRFMVKGHEAFARALPVCDAALREGGLLVVGPDEIAVARRTLRLGSVAQLEPVTKAALRASLSPGRVLLVRTYVEEQIAKMSKALFDRRGQPRGAERDVQITLRVRIIVRAPGGGEPLVEGEVSAREDPFAELPEHDRRPLIKKLLGLLAPRVFTALWKRVRRPVPWPAALGAEALASPSVLESFRLGTEPSLADDTRRDPLLGGATRDLYRRTLGHEVSDRELASWNAAPRGVLLRESLGEAGSGDVVTAVGTEPVVTPWALHRAMFRASGPGLLPSALSAKVWRAGKELRVPLPDIRVERRVGAAAHATGDRRLARVERQ